MPRPRRFDLHAVDDLARSQGGIVLHRQLVEMGMSSSTISRWTRTGGRWQRLLPGTYLVHRGTPTWIERLHGAVHYAGPRSILTGAAALHLHNLRNLPDRLEAMPVHLLVPDSCKRASAGFVTVERTQRLPVPISVRGFPVAPLPRAVFDAGRRNVSRQKVRAFTLEAVQRKMMDVEELRQEIRAGQRQWTAVLRDVVGDARSGVLSVPEAGLRDLVRSSDLPEPLWNPRLETVTGEFIAEPDGYYEDLGIALEVDSRRHHFEAEGGYEATWRRHLRFTRQGIAVIRVMPLDIRDRPMFVLRSIAESRAAHAERRSPEVVVKPRRR